MTGFQIRVRNVRLKSDPSGKVIISKATKKIPGKPDWLLKQIAERKAQEWKDAAAEHYTPMDWKEET